MPSRNWRSGLLRGLLLTILTTALLLWLGWHWLLAAQGISQLEWQGAQLSRDGLQLQQLQLLRSAGDGSRLQLHAQQLQLAWPQAAGNSLYLPQLRSRELRLDWQAGARQQPAATGLPVALAWLPRQLDIDSLALELPCTTGRCQLLGSLQLSHAGTLQQPAALNLELHLQEQMLQVQASLAQHASQWQLFGEITLDRQAVFNLRSQLDGLRWQGHLELLQLADSRSLFAWLQQWQLLDPRLLSAQAAGSLQADWQLLLPAEQGHPALQRLLAGSGSFTLAFQLHSPLLQGDGFKAEVLQLEAALHGHLDGEQLQINLQPATLLQIGSLQLDDQLRLQQLRAGLAGLQLQVARDSWQLSGPLQLQTAQLEQSALLTQAWQFSGQLEASADQQHLQGKLSNAGALRLTLEVARQASGDLRLSASLAELFLRAGNPLADTLRDWPALLQFSNGRVQGRGSLHLPVGGARRAELALQLQGLTGIFDRTELSGLDGNPKLVLQGAQLTLELADMTLRELNPGLPLGPLQLQGGYQAAVARPLQGVLSWQVAQSGLFGGRIWLDAGELDLGSDAQLLKLQFEDVQLAEILRVYPAEGLAGQGSLAGELPLRLDAAGLHVEDGTLGARSPGFLQFRSPQMHALGQSNPAMRLAVDALENFHYQLLQSSVSYTPDGQLLLGLRLQGRNPDVEKGRPINLSINLQEDIPALLTSLQLTDRVSEIIRQRVQQQLRQADAP
jgi:hypothetical protein